MEIKSYLKEKRLQVDEFIINYFSTALIKPDVLKSSMLYSLTAGGKRVRPILCIAAYEACGGERSDEIVPLASALEFIHTYSLVHDDLPSMDNDDLRRGKPTNHKLYGEAIAILAGDALLTEAFYILSSHAAKKNLKVSPNSILKVISEVAHEIGAYGMVGGQAQDILSEGSEPNEEILSFIHLKKTAAFISISVKIGGILAECDHYRIECLREYGENIGLSFQIIDDILDVEGNTDELGKPAGSDERKNKMTYPRLYGIEKSKEKAKEAISKAILSLKDFDSKADNLREIATYLLSRKS